MVLTELEFELVRKQVLALKMAKKLELNLMSGKITKEKYDWDTLLLKQQIIRLKKMQINLFDQKIAKLESELIKFEQPHIKALNIPAAGRAQKELMRKHSELESERDFLKVADIHSFIKFLDNLFQTKKYKKIILQLGEI